MTGRARVNRVRCEHVDITGDLVAAYCSRCVAETMRLLGVDEVTARFVLAHHHGFEEAAR